MSESILTETTLSLAQAAKRLPPYRADRPVGVSCLTRWIVTGVKGPNGTIHLEALRCGGRWITSVEALQRFIFRQTPSTERVAERAGSKLQPVGT